MNKDNKWVIFDLDGTLANIDKRRLISKNINTGKMNWDIFFNPDNIKLDQPNHPVIHMARTLKAAGHNIAIFSGRSKATKQVTIDWLKQHDVPFDVIKMRPTGKDFHFMKDNLLKQRWLDDLFPDKSKIVCVFDDRNQVVDMWRSNGITCMQVAPGDF